MSRLLITGAGGFLGAHVRARVSDGYEVLARSYASLPESLIREFAPTAVLHLAAMTSPDACERQPDAAREANVDWPERIARAVEPSVRTFVGASTDLVFDGERGPYRESDEAAPLSVYGHTKLAGERVLHEVLGDRAVVVRLTLLYGPRRHPAARESFAETMVRRAQSGEAVHLYADQWRSPLYVEDAASGLLRLLEQPEREPVLHFGGPERCSRYEMGKVAFEQFGLSPELAIPSRMADVPAAAARPKDVSLDSRRARRLGLEARGLREGFAAFRDTILPPGTR